MHEDGSTHRYLGPGGNPSYSRDGKRIVFIAGEYGGKRQEIPDNFAQVEKAIAELESKAISPETHCTVGHPL